MLSHATMDSHPGVNASGLVCPEANALTGFLAVEGKRVDAD
jgi:hypothetical protein